MIHGATRHIPITTNIRYVAVVYDTECMHRDIAVFARFMTRSLSSGFLSELSTLRSLDPSRSSARHPMQLRTAGCVHRTESIWRGPCWVLLLPVVRCTIHGRHMTVPELGSLSCAVTTRNAKSSLNAPRYHYKSESGRCAYLLQSFIVPSELLLAQYRSIRGIADAPALAVNISLPLGETSSQFIAFLCAGAEPPSNGLA